MSMLRTNRAALALGVCGLLLVACGHTPEKHNAVYLQAVDFNRRAQAAYQRGDYQAAAGFYEASLQLDEAIENLDGIAINLLNLAELCRASDRPQQADAYLEQMLQPGPLQFKPAYLASAAIQRAALKLRAGDPTAAAAWADRAAGYCGSACGVEGVIYNLRAGIALANKDANAALQWGKQAAAENKENQLEYANSLRIMGQAVMVQGDFGAARKLLEEALALDKELGLPAKIRIDLEQLATACDGMKLTDLARQYRERAQRVGLAIAGDN